MNAVPGDLVMNHRPEIVEALSGPLGLMSTGTLAIVVTSDWPNSMSSMLLLSMGGLLFWGLQENWESP